MRVTLFTRGCSCDSLRTRGPAVAACIHVSPNICWRDALIWSLSISKAGLFAIRSEREFVLEEDFMKAVRKVADAKKLETKLDYKPV